jgi:arylsulfatase A-like enzyme
MIGTIAEQCDLSNTIVVFTADHGDILGDHGLWDKGLYAYDPVVKVPLLIKVPDIEHVRYPHLTEAVDLVKTLVSHNDLKYNIENQFRHNIISQAVKGNPGRRYVFSAIGKHQPRVRMVRNNQFKYWWGLTAPGHLEYLYNLDDDPGEIKNLAQFDHANLSLMRSILIEALIYSGA